MLNDSKLRMSVEIFLRSGARGELTKVVSWEARLSNCRAWSIVTAVRRLLSREPAGAFRAPEVTQEESESHLRG